MWQSLRGFLRCTEITLSAILSQMKFYKTYLFDIDGTLLNTMELIYQSFKNTCREYSGLEVSRKLVWSHVGIPLSTQLEMYLGKLGDRMNDVLILHNSYQTSIYKEYLQIFPGVKTTIATLYERRVNLGIVSSRTRPSLDRYLKHFEMDTYFSVIATPECTEKHKPEPDPVIWALEQFEAKPGDTLFVGDADVDMKSGRAAGVDTAFALWGPNKVDELTHSPTWSLKGIEELI